MLRRIARAATARGIQRATAPRPDRILFNSFNGHYSDNPRAIAEELERQHSAAAAWWVGAEGAGRSGAAATSPLYSPAYYRAAGSAGTVVSNVHMPTNFVKRRSVTYVQTWHGTPLKQIGLDNPQWSADRAGLKAMLRDCANWDVLVSQNAFSSEVFRRAFRFDGQIIETGYPRNDALSAPTNDETRDRVRRELGLADGELAILYAPTWRDNLVTGDNRAGFELALDVATLADRLGEGHTLLLRLHYMVSPQARTEGVLNVSRYPDIRELYLASDVLITDYSSAMFDYAVTGKPLIFFTYDLVEYRDAVRGFTFELAGEAPGPLCQSSGEVADALADLPAVVDSHRDRYAAFKAKFCPLDDGRAAARVVDAVPSLVTSPV